MFLPIDHAGFFAGACLVMPFAKDLFARGLSAMAAPVADFQTFARLANRKQQALVKKIVIVSRVVPPLILTKVNGGISMSDHRPLVIAATVGTLAVSANGAALLIALSPAAPPQAAAFGIIGLTTAFIGLIITILWACHREEPKLRTKRARISKPQRAPAAGDTAAYRLPEPRRQSALALAAAPLASAPQAAPAAAPAKVEAQVIVLQDWLKAHRRPQQRHA